MRAGSVEDSEGKRREMMNWKSLMPPQLLDKLEVTSALWSWVIGNLSNCPDFFGDHLRKPTQTLRQAQGNLHSCAGQFEPVEKKLRYYENKNNF